MSFIFGMTLQIITACKNSSGEVIGLVQESLKVKVYDKTTQNSSRNRHYLTSIKGSASPAYSLLLEIFLL